MGNQPTKALHPDDGLPDGSERVADTPGAISESESPVKSPHVPPSCSSTSLSSESDQDESPANEETTTCSLSSGSPQCIPVPGVLSFCKKEGPLLVTSGRVVDDDDDDDDASDGSSNDDDEQDLQGRQTSIARETTTCSPGHRRRRSWSPKPNRRLNFFSKYSVGSSSTSSLSSLIAKTKQQLIPTTKYMGGFNEAEKAMPDGHLPTQESDLANRLRDYFIVTTAALPWFTGTAVNPLLRAASISQYQRRQFAASRCTVTLVIPWLEMAQDRVELYGPDWQDKTQADQEAYIREWLSKANMPDEAKSPEEDGIQILFYAARYHSKLSSIFAMGDLCEFIAENNSLTHIREEDAVCVLEEPEHVHFYRAQHWRHYFCHVVGIVHTNYKAYASTAMVAGSFITGPLIAGISSWLVRAYCDKVIKLSPVLQSFGCPEKEVVSNVHGIRHDFIVEGERRAREALEENDDDDKQQQQPHDDKIYFVGKLLWAKGLDKLLELEGLYRSMTGNYFPIDIYGSGPEQEEIEQAFLSERPRFLGGRTGSSSALEDLTNRFTGNVSPDPTQDSEATTSGSNSNNASNSRRATYYSTFVRPNPPVPANFKGREDHALLTKDYKIFVNPSITEVLCTTSAEATAMGKFVIIPDHPSNQFFHQFPNCLLYKTKTEFVDFLQYAITHEPEPLRDELIRKLTWEAATERFIKASAISRRDAAWRERVGKTKSDENIAKMHYELGKGPRGDVLRKVLGGGPVADQSLYESRMQSQSESSSESEDESSTSSSEDEADSEDEGSIASSEEEEEGPTIVHLKAVVDAGIEV